MGSIVALLRRFFFKCVCVGFRVSFHRERAVVLNLAEADISIRILNSKNYLQPAHHLFFPLLAGFYDESI